MDTGLPAPTAEEIRAWREFQAGERARLALDMIKEADARALTAVPDPDDADDIVHDFDADWAARDAKAPKVKICGKVYRLPGEIPAKIILYAAKAKKSGLAATDVVDETQLVDMLNSLLGKDNVAQIMDDGLGVRQMADVMNYCMDTYKDMMPGAATTGEVPAPLRGNPTTP
jgi:hypothetical protein